jgi:hypothetical protein
MSDPFPEDEESRPTVDAATFLRELDEQERNAAMDEEPKPEAEPPQTLAIASVSSERANAHAQALLGLAPDTAPDERVLLDLVAAELPLAFELRRLETQLAARVGLLLENPTLAVAVAKVLRDVANLSGAVARRVQGSLGVAANLRAQRRLLAVQRGGR